MIETFLNERILMIIYIDLDGVLADFDGYYQEITGLTPKAYESIYGTEKFWEQIYKDGDYFNRLEKTSFADRLISFVFDVFPDVEKKILTALPRDYNNEFKTQKIRWVQRYYGDLFSIEQILLSPSGEGKAQFAQPGDILIDDMQKNIDAWNAVGGNGVLVSDSEYKIFTELALLKTFQK